MTSPVRPTAKLTAELSDEEIEASLEAGKQLLTIAEVAHMFRKTPATVRIWFNSRTMRAKKINGMWYTIESEVLRYMTRGNFKEES